MGAHQSLALVCSGFLAALASLGPEPQPEPATASAGRPSVRWLATLSTIRAARHDLRIWAPTADFGLLLLLLLLFYISATMATTRNQRQQH